MSNTTTLLQLPPLSLYVHIPWCVRKCPYCDFNSHTSDNFSEQEYCNALIADLEQELNLVQERQLQSIFFGGGTPSLFSAQAISFLLTEINHRIAFSPSIEITLEANPGTVEQEKFSGYYAAGINRLSIGIQSFDPNHLQSLGRIHNDKEAIKAVKSAFIAGFENINIDLMHGLPNQKAEQSYRDLRTAIDLKPTHISWYQLTIEPNTAFYSSPPLLPCDDELADIQQGGEQVLQQAGFLQYETSAYATTGLQSKHNTNYWQFGDYIGIGAGAHGKLTTPQENKIVRKKKTRMPNDYTSKIPAFTAGENQLTNGELPLEFFMNSLRLNKGFSINLYQQRTGLEFHAIKPKIDKLISRQLLMSQDQNILPTSLGKRFLNSVLAEF